MSIMGFADSGIVPEPKPAPSNTDLREAVAKKLKFWRKKELSDLYYPLDEIMQIFQAREQQLLTELLGEAEVYDTHEFRGGTANSTEQAVPVVVIERMLGASGNDLVKCDCGYAKCVLQSAHPKQTNDGGDT